MTHVPEQPPFQDGAVVIVNTGARRGRNAAESIARSLAERGIGVVATHPVRKPKLIPGLVAQLIAAGRRLIVIGGGDGTVTSVVPSFIGSEAVMALVPLGTGNSFARGLGIPLDVPGAIAAIAGGKVVRVDAGIVNGEYFANLAAVGLSTLVARRTSSLAKRILGPVAYLLTGMGIAPQHRYFDCTIDADGAIHRFRCHQVVVANGPFFGATPIHPDARLDDGRLRVFALPGAHRRQIRRMWIALLAGRQANLSDALFLTAKRIVVTTRPSHSVDVDGEVVTRTPANFTVEPAALRVIAPQTFVESTHSKQLGEIEPADPRNPAERKP